MNLNRIPRLPGRHEVPTAPTALQLIARLLNSAGCSLRRAVLSYHIRNARHELYWLDELMRQDRAELLAAHGLQQAQAVERIEARQVLDEAQHRYLITHLARLRAQRAALAA